MASSRDPLISVIIPTFNREKLLLRAIDSVLAQDYNNYDLWIIDDGSTDDTQRAVRPYIEQKKNLQDINYIKTENHGVSSARNLGVEKSTGQWLAFLDSDDEWLPNKLFKQVKFIEKHPAIRIVHGEEIWIRRGVRVNQKKIHQKYGGMIFQKCLPLCLISPSAVIIHRDLYNEMGGFDPDFVVCEDYDLWLKITSKYQVGFISDPIIIKYGGHSDQLSQKYVAMDYWRIKSLCRILEIRNLNDQDRHSLLREIVGKAQILLAGNKKHHNMQNSQEVLELLSKKGLPVEEV